VNRTLIRSLAVSTAAAAASLGAVAGINAGAASYGGAPSAQAQLTTDLQAQVPTAERLAEENYQRDKALARIGTEKRQAREAAAKAAAEKAAAEKRRTAREAAARASRARARAALLTGSPKDIARRLVAARGWGSGQFSCLDSLWTKESRWNHRATNPSSGAYGIPQALPGSKMASAGSDWRSNPATQIKWGLSYIADRYGTPCGAWSHSKARGWY